LSDSPQNILGQLDISDKEENRVPHALMRNAKTEHFSQNGSLSYSFEAEKLSYFRANNESFSFAASGNFTTIEKPKIVVYREGTPLEIIAEKGRINSDESIQLEEQVIILQENEDGTETRFLTEKLLFKPEEKLALTDEAVTILSPFGRIDAVGMRADIIQKKHTLLSHVRGVYEPKH
jgi:lipopolysaccharide export system protein LptC